MSCTADVQVCIDGNVVVLRVGGEIGIRTLPALHDALDAAVDGAVDRASRHVVVDLTGVRFCSVEGFVLLADVARSTAAAGFGYALSGLPDHLVRLSRAVWADQAPFTQHGTAEQALTAIRVAAGGARPPLSCDGGRTSASLRRRGTGG